MPLVRILTAGFVAHDTTSWSEGFRLVASNHAFGTSGYASDITDALGAEQCQASISSFTGASTWNEFSCDTPITGRYIAYLVPGDDKIACFCEIEVCV